MQSFVLPLEYVYTHILFIFFSCFKYLSFVAVFNHLRSEAAVSGHLSRINFILLDIFGSLSTRGLYDHPVYSTPAQDLYV